MNSNVLLCLVALILVTLLLMYNALIGKKNQVNFAFAGLDAMLQKRYDLVPNLVATVQGYMTHERGLLTQIVELRRNAADGTTATFRHSADVQLSDSLAKLVVLSEAYPDLQAAESFLQLQVALNEIEEHISAARRAFNATITDYNNAVEMFPTSMMAAMMGLRPKEWYEIADEQRQNVVIAGTLGP